MTERSRPGGWGEVDADQAAEYYTDYLETVTGAAAVQGYKRRSHQLLQPDEGDSVLDVGCGTGEDVSALADLVGADGEVLGVDRGETMVEAARERAGDADGVRFAVADALALPVADDAVDAARADRVLQHLPAPAEAVAELRRVTRPGGRVGVSDPDWATAVLDVPGETPETFLSLDHAVPRNPTTGRRLYRLATDAGLVDLDVDTWTLVSTDLGFLRQAGELDAWTDAMVADGEVTERAVERWFDRLRRADERGSLFGSITGYTVVGTVPEPKEGDA